MIKRNAIWFILAIAFFGHLYHIGFPVAGFQSWRQSDTAAMARNFYENGFRFLNPQIDWGGNSPGYVETEFPLYPFLVSLLYAIFFPSDMWGRLLSTLFALATIFWLYKLIRKCLGENVALWSTFVYAIIPLNIFYTRAFMPESMMLMSSVMGVYFFTEWLDRRKALYFALSAFFIALAALLKIPALYLGLPLLYLSWLQFGRKLLLRWQLWLFAVLVFSPVCAWYYHAHHIFLTSGLTFGIWEFGSDKWGIAAPLYTVKFYNDILFKSIAERHLTYAGFIPFVVGLFIKRTSKRERVFDWWLIAVVIYFVIVTVGNQVHEYYQLPFIIPAVVFIGKTFNRYLSNVNVRAILPKRNLQALGLIVCLVAIPILSFLRLSNFMQGEQQDSNLFHLATAVQNRTSPQDLVVTVSEGNPVYLYLSHRKGWNSFPGTLTPQFLQEKASRGARYLIGDKETFVRTGQEATLQNLLDHYPSPANTDEYFILDITSMKRPG